MRSYNYKKDCIAVAIQGVISKLNLNVDISYLMQPSFIRKPNSSTDKGTVFGNKANPIIALEEHGVAISQRKFTAGEMDDFLDYLSDAECIVINHLYATILKNLNMAKELPSGVKHMFFTKELNPKKNNILFRTSDEYFKVISWRHLFDNQQDAVTVYKFHKSTLNKDFKLSVRNNFENSLSRFIEHSTPEANRELLAFHRAAYERGDAKACLVWINLVRLIYAQRAWCARFIVKEYGSKGSAYQELIAIRDLYLNAFTAFNTLTSTLDYDECLPYFERIADAMNREIVLVNSILNPAIGKPSLVAV
ncbi:hypothetical protein ACSI5G_004001 [Vibrio vulnificus]|nr:hypothetical protein [Vibrio vulnificus]HAS8118916.1 hypothetical protein [Vibrio vulnificus]